METAAMNLFFPMQAELCNCWCHEMCSPQVISILTCVSHDWIHVYKPRQMNAMQIYKDIVVLHINPFRYDRHEYDCVWKRCCQELLKRGDKRQGCQDNPYQDLSAYAISINLQLARRVFKVSELSLDTPNHFKLIHLHGNALSNI